MKIQFISFISLFISACALIIANFILLKDNKYLIDKCFKYKQILNKQFGSMADDYTKISDINLIYTILKKAESEGFAIDDTEISCVRWYDDFKKIKEFEGEKRPIDDVYFIEHEEYILIEDNLDYFVIECIL